MERSDTILERSMRSGVELVWVEDISQTDLRSGLCYICQEDLTVPCYSDPSSSYGMHFECLDLPSRMEHQVHPEHTIVAEDGTEPGSLPCHICSTTLDGAMAYRCLTCPFRIHQKCLFNKLPFHPHKLELIYSLSPNPSGRSIYCQICQQDLTGQNYIYHCDKCSFFLHSYNCRPVVNSTHEHPLMMVEEAASTYCAPDDCYACAMLIYPPYYVCVYKSCYRTSRHRLCGLRALETEHLSEDSESIFEMMKRMGLKIFLVEESSGIDVSSSLCHVCEANITVPYYRSHHPSNCDLHKACGDLPLRMEHQVHPGHTIVIESFNPGHTIITESFNRTSEIKPCDICRKVDGGMCYRCNTCPFRVHTECLTHKLPFHPHELKLIYSLPENRSGRSIYCQICRLDMKGQNYIYNCDKCRYFVHNYNCRPMVHFSHDHPLMLVEETTSTYSASDKCYGCGLMISLPYYCCIDKSCSSIYLHKHCAEPSPIMEHRLHPANHTNNPMENSESIFEMMKRSGAEIFLVEESPEADFSARFCHICKANTRFPYYRDERNETDMHKACGDLPLRMEHESHPGHIIIFDDAPTSNLPCSICRRVPNGMLYRCMNCEFTIHPECLSKKLPFHLHELKLIHSLPRNRSGRSINCQICQEDLKGQNYIYHCSKCRNFVHNYNCRPVVHSSHEHPLMLVEEATSTYSASEKCYGCGLKISPPYLFCLDKSCASIFLHKHCAELTPNLKHYLHPAHTLTLSNEVKSYEPVRMCNACHLPVKKEFSYSCADTSCRFTLDTTCAMKKLYRKHEFHEHPLLSSHSKTSHECRACNLDSEGPSYQCSTCRFWVHQQCASLPKLRTIDWHPHKLNLIYSLPEDSQRNHCHVCRKEIHPHNWAYHCVGCRFFTHVHNCSDSCRDIEGFDYEAALAAAIQLPVANECVSLAKLVLMDVNQEEVKELEPQPLEEKGTNTSEMFISYPKETCRKCVQLLAPPCEKCAVCRCLLSRSISQLNEPIQNDGDTCLSCEGLRIDNSVNGLNVQISSSVLPCYVKHEGHHHVLSTTYITKKDTWCYACEDDFVGYGFKCNICDFTIDTYCALLPGSVKHRSDDKGHRFKLTCFSVEGVEEYICEICEGDIKIRWFYHCEECDYSIHPRCIWNNHIRFGPFIQHDSTKHYITLVPTAMTLGFDCLVCHKKEISGHVCSYSLFCEGCFETVHLHCIPDIQIEKFSGKPRQGSELMHYKSLGISALEKRPTCLKVFMFTPDAGVNYSNAAEKWDTPESDVND